MLGISTVASSRRLSHGGGSSSGGRLNTSVQILFVNAMKENEKDFVPRPLTKPASSLNSLSSSFKYRIRQVIKGNLTGRTWPARAT
jgi:hypothetical protein